MKRKLLLIAPKFFNYYQMIIKEAERQDYDVDYFADNPNKHKLSMTISRINRLLVLFYVGSYFKKEILPFVKEKKYDIFLFIYGMSFALSEKMIKTIREYNPEARFIMYQWDAQANIPNAVKLHKYMDSIYSNELNDCYRNSSFKFIPNFYIPMYENTEKEAAEFDCSHIGAAHPKKYADIKKYDLYDETNILVSDENPEYKDPFFKYDLKDIAMSKYSLPNWMKNVLNEEQSSYLKKRKKRILYLCSRNFFSLNSGHEIKMLHYLKALNSIYDADVDLFVFDTDNTNESAVHKYALKICYGKNVSHTEKIRNLLFKTLSNGEEWPIQTALYFSKMNFELIKEMSLENHYDMVVVDMIRLVPYLSAIGYPCTKVLDMDDLLSKRYQRQLKNMSTKTMIAGAYEDRLPSFVRRFLSHSLIKKTILKLEIKRVKKAEEKAYRDFDYVLFVSNREADEMNQKCHGDKAVGVGMGTDCEYFSEDTVSEKEAFTASFVGNMFYPPNADSIRYIVNEIIENSKYLKHFYIIGKYPDSIKEEFSNNEKVIFLGRVDDIREAVKKTNVFLSPILYGTGIKTKILEALAMGMPVITNDIGAEGIDVENGKNIIISNNAKELTEILDKLLVENEKRETLGESAMEFAKTNLDWSIFYKNFSLIRM